MGKYIVMDVVFKASSLNYDQGSGNYQELKKITRWNGKQHTLVSRYALRYSLLETSKQFVDGSKLQLAGDGPNKVIQPATDLLLSGEILKYPEFDLFGYLITSTEPQNFRAAPVKLSHAVSMTPFNYDALFNANLGMANRMRKIYGDMKPNPFTTEEHETFYLYSIVVDVASIGKLDMYLKKDGVVKRGKNGNEKWKVVDVREKEGKISLKEDKKKNPREDSIEVAEGVKMDTSAEEGIYHIVYATNDTDSKIKTFVNAVLNLHRSIKARDEDLSPKLLVLGLYENAPYKTFKDRIALVDELTEESIDEIIETTDGNKKTVKVVHKTVKHAKPKFKIHGIEGKAENLEDNNILKKIDNFLKDDKKQEEQEELIVYKLPEIEIELDNKNVTSTSNGTEKNL